jgi:hypothetical protein
MLYILLTKLFVTCSFPVDNFSRLLSGEKWGKVFYFYIFTSHIIQKKFKV